MRLEKYLAKNRIIDLNSTNFADALNELLSLASEHSIPENRREEILKDLLEREDSISTYLGNGICMPHTRVDFLKSEYLFFVGRCKNGLKFKDKPEYENIKFVFMLLANPGEEGYLNVLAGLAKIFSESENVSKIFSSKNLGMFKDRVIESFIGSEGKRAKNTKENKVFLNGADTIAKGKKCSTVVVLGDTFEDGVNLGKYFDGMRVVLVSELSAESFSEKFDAVVNVRAFSPNRMAQLKSAILMGLTKGIFKDKDKLCCIGGSRGSNLIDTIIVIDVEKEFSHFFIRENTVLPLGVRPEVVERVVDIATELSIEGREGKPVGCLFVVGDKDKIKPYLKQLVLNPFYGYKPEDRNVLNPFMDETVKEYSMIDGAIIIDGSGTLESAGTLIHTPDFVLKLPGGLGARHAAAYSISTTIDCLAFVVSSSTGQLSLFRNGQMLPLTDKRKN